MWLQRIVYVVFDTMSMTFAMFSKNLEYLDRVIRDARRDDAHVNSTLGGKCQCMTHLIGCLLYTSDVYKRQFIYFVALRILAFILATSSMIEKGFVT